MNVALAIRLLAYQHVFDSYQGLGKGVYAN